MNETGDDLWSHLNSLGDGFNHECVQVSNDHRYIKCVLDKVIVEIFGETEQFAPLLVELWKAQLKDAKYSFYYSEMTKIYYNFGYDATWADVLCEKI